MRICSCIVALSVLAPTPAGAQIGSLLKQLGGTSVSALPDAKVTSGLKEALRVGAENAVTSTGRTDGYFANTAIRILMPKNWRTVETALRAAGLGKDVDGFILGMNRAAERAAPEAKSIFGDAILEMTFEDARGILQGTDTAATEYFKRKTTPRLTGAFRPVVEKAMADIGVVRQYDDLMRRVPVVPFAQLPSLDIRTYVVTKALDGLFLILGQEEQKIRKNPAARVTSLLQDVFGRGGAR